MSAPGQEGWLGRRPSVQSQGSFRSAASLSGTKVVPSTAGGAATSRSTDEKRWSQARYSNDIGFADVETSEEKREADEKKSGIDEMRLSEIMRMVFNKLDGGLQNRVQRQDLLSLSTKLRDPELLEVVRNDAWLKPLLHPEVWGRQLLRTFDKGGFISFEAFIDFWEKFSQDYEEYTGEADSQRRDSIDSWRSFVSAGSSHRPPNVNFPGSAGGQRKVLRALSVRSKSSDVDSVQGSVAGSGAARLTRRNAVRVTVQSGLQKSRPGSPIGPPQVVMLPDSLDELLELACDRLGIPMPNPELIVMHAILQAQVTHLEDLREGDSLQVVRRQDASAGRAKTGLKIKTSLHKVGAKGKKCAVSNNQKEEQEEEQAKGKQGSCITTSADLKRTCPTNEVSNFAAFIRRPSWNKQYASKRLPEAVKSNVRNILHKIAMSSNRWQKPHPLEECPDQGELQARLAPFESMGPLALETVFQAIEQLGITFGFGRSHVRVLFDAVDRESTGFTSFCHLQDLVALWREAWIMNQQRLAKAENAVQASRDRAALIDTLSGGGAQQKNSSKKKGRPQTASAVRPSSLVAKTASAEASAPDATCAVAVDQLSPEKQQQAKNQQQRPLTPSRERKSGKFTVPFCSKVSNYSSHNAGMNINAQSNGKRVFKAKADANEHSRQVVRASSRPSTPSASSRDQRPRTAPPSRTRPGSASKLPKAPSDTANKRSGPKTEEEFLRLLHKSETDDAALLYDYATFLLRKVERPGSATKGQELICLPEAFDGEGDLGLSAARGNGVGADKHETSQSPINVLEPPQLKRVQQARELLKRALSAANLEKHVAKRCEDPAVLSGVRVLRANILCRLGETCELMNNFSQARSLFHKAIEENPSSSTILTKYGTFLSKVVNDTGGAREYFLEALVHDRDCIGALLGYAVILATSDDRSDAEQAAAYFERTRCVAGAMGSGKGVPKDLRARALVQVGIYQNEYQGQHEQALKSLERAVELDGNFPGAWFEIGRMRFAALGDIQGAVDAFEGALRADPSHAKSLVALAQILANSIDKADVHRADTLFKQACESEPKNTRTHLSYAEFCSKLLRAEFRAEELFERAFDSATERLRPACLFKWAECFERKADRVGDSGCRLKAVALYEKAAVLHQQQLDADLEEVDEESANNASFLESSEPFLVGLGKCALRANLLAKAREALHEAMAADPTSVTAKWLAALTEQHLGRRAKAGKLFRAAYEEDAENGFVMVHFARFLLDYRGPPEAQQQGIAESMLRKSLKLAQREQDTTNKQSVYFESFEAMAMVTLGKLLCSGTKGYVEGLDLLARACEICPKAAEPKFLYAECLSNDLFHDRAALYPALRLKSRGKCGSGGTTPSRRYRNETLLRVDNAVRNFIAVADLDEQSVLGPIKAATLLIFQAYELGQSEKEKNLLAKLSALEKAIRYAERAAKRATKALEVAQVQLESDPENEQKLKLVAGLKRKLAEANFLQGVALERADKRREASAQFRASLRHNDSHVLALFHLANRKEKDYDDLSGAEAAVSQAFKVVPTSEKQKTDQSILCKLVLQAYQNAEADFLESEGEASGADPQKARALVMHQHLAKKARDLTQALI